MSSISVTDYLNSTFDSYTAGSTSTSDSYQDLFLTLLTTELENQDPLDPADSTEFTSQLAQFSSLEQLTNMNSTLEEVVDSLASTVDTQAVNYIGKEVVASGSTIEVDSDGIDPILISLDGDAATLYVNIYDSSGDFVTQLEAGSVEAGNFAITWDGTDKSGNTVSQGDYTYEVQAVDSDGESVEASSYISGTVTAVSYEEDGTYLSVNGSLVSLADVIEVGAADESE